MNQKREFHRFSWFSYGTGFMLGVLVTTISTIIQHANNSQPVIGILSWITAMILFGLVFPFVLAVSSHYEENTDITQKQTKTS